MIGVVLVKLLYKRTLNMLSFKHKCIANIEQESTYFPTLCVATKLKYRPCGPGVEASHVAYTCGMHFKFH